MKGIYLFLFLLYGIINAHAQQPKWLTSEVLREMGIETCNPCFTAKEIQPQVVGENRITVIRIASFDTTASYAQGRIVDMVTGKPIGGATIQAHYACWKNCELKTAVTNKQGFFRLGWVGCGGPEGGRSNRPILIKARGYQTINTAAIRFGGSAYLHVELTAPTIRR